MVWKTEYGMDKGPTQIRKSSFIKKFKYFFLFFFFFFMEKEIKSCCFINKWYLLFPSLSALHVRPRDIRCAEFTNVRSMHNIYFSYLFNSPPFFLFKFGNWFFFLTKSLDNDYWRYVILTYSGKDRKISLSFISYFWSTIILILFYR